ncbi:hypothetical protein HMSP1_17 [Sinorhizobium phage HMSP1-Susan]|nr:hypothetical protein HMSP1_17 [Sinorhizobium phage HMSP1-Susan]
MIHWRFATFLAIIAYTVGYVTSTAQFDRPYGSREMDKLCSTFVMWQDVMRRDGYPESRYAETGMEKFCPGMI